MSPFQRLRWSTGSPEDPKTDDVLFVSDLLNHLQATLCIDEHRIYATGFSSGGGMTGVRAGVVQETHVDQFLHQAQSDTVYLDEIITGIFTKRQQKS